MLRFLTDKPHCDLIKMLKINSVKALRGPKSLLLKSVCLLLAFSLSACSDGAPDDPSTAVIVREPIVYAEGSLAAQAHAALLAATVYLTEQVAYQGGYLGAYTADLSEGFAKLGAKRPFHMHWVEPPGTPAMGMAYVKAWQATADRTFLDAAKETARALIWGQLATGGWYDYIDHSPTGEQVFRYRRHIDRPLDSFVPVDLREYQRATGLSVHEMLPAANQSSSFDDDITQSATRLLMVLDRELNAMGERADDIHEAAMAALDGILHAQFAVGAWPQNYPSMQGPRSVYDSHYTLNDDAHVDCARVLMMAYEIYGDKRYYEAAVRAGEFLIAHQLPEPVPVWAQQYDHDGFPAWGRLFEPPAAVTTESFDAMELLVDLTLFTGEKRFLDPLDAAIAFYRRARLSDGRWARFYELKTGKPLYQRSMRRTAYWLTYDDSDLPDHYSFKLGGGFIQMFTGGIDAMEARVAAIREMGVSAYLNQKETQSAAVDGQGMTTSVERILRQQDAGGRWVDRVRGREMIQLRTFQDNMAQLSSYLEAVAKESQGAD